jgi:hypothetical protein
MRKSSEPKSGPFVESRNWRLDQRTTSYDFIAHALKSRFFTLTTAVNVQRFTS